MWTEGFTNRPTSTPFKSDHWSDWQSWQNGEKNNCISTTSFKQQCDVKGIDDTRQYIQILQSHTLQKKNNITIYWSVITVQLQLCTNPLSLSRSWGQRKGDPLSLLTVSLMGCPFTRLHMITMTKTWPLSTSTWCSSRVPLCLQTAHLCLYFLIPSPLQHRLRFSGGRQTREFPLSQNFDNDLCSLHRFLWRTTAALVKLTDVS